MFADLAIWSELAMRVDVQDVESEHEKAIFLCECKYWDKNVDISAMRAIIDGLNQKWQLEVVLLFCMKLASYCKEWENPDIGCVKVDFSTQPKQSKTSARRNMQ
ncbi:tRNA endonuclease-like domain [Plasmopara halstedii]|uniref:tRNA endonuclease-like domain n=1 Tax=Plasmopara halstedii TaxID=4781 RepID=A0A0N7L7K7_PLAHL|nr:tRNA endonuclease-like domain [Plasmopara halstedii]CEG47347.1 tRNA endonuclease-like domain [Plasmopara halstedii]|eukprot:XP_024583716.1 tRNA endonuclease-like domain [Plasmopara halstedii]